MAVAESLAETTTPTTTTTTTTTEALTEEAAAEEAKAAPAAAAAVQRDANLDVGNISGEIAMEEAAALQESLEDLESANLIQAVGLGSLRSLEKI